MLTNSSHRESGPLLSHITGKVKKGHIYLLLN